MNANVPIPFPLGGGLPAGLSLDRLLRRPLKWTANSGWLDSDGAPVPSPLLVVGYLVALERWRVEEGKNLVEHKFEHPLPDPETLNAEIPITEWKLGLNSQPEKPWKLIYVVTMINTATGAVYTYKNSTYGALLMYEQLAERIAVKQMLSGGERAYPIVCLEKREWHSATFGTQLRPHLEPIDWCTVGKGAQPAPQLTAPTLTAIPTPAPAATPTPAPKADVYAPVTPPAPAASTSAANAGPPWEETPHAPVPAAPMTPTNLQPLKPVTVAELVADEIPETKWQ